MGCGRRIEDNLGMTIEGVLATFSRNTGILAVARCQLEMTIDGGFATRFLRQYFC